MKRRKIFLCLTAVCAVVLWLGAMALYYAYVNDNVNITYVAVSLIICGTAGVITFFLLSSFPDNNLKLRWLKLYADYMEFLDLRENGEKCDTEYKACLEKIRENYFSDNDKNKNRIEKPNVYNGKKFCDFSVLQSGNVYYGCLVIANVNLYKSSRFVFKTFPAVFIYSTDDYFSANPKQLIDIAEWVYKDGLNGLLSNQSKYFSNVKICTEQTGNREVYITVVMVCRRQLPFGRLDGKIVPLIANPLASNSVFVADCKYWTGEITDLYHYEKETKDSYGQPFGI